MPKSNDKPAPGDARKASPLASDPTAATDPADAAAALRESNERIRLAAEAGRLGFWSLDPQTGERYWSPELRRLVGLPADITPTAELLLSGIHPDDRPRVA